MKARLHEFPEPSWETVAVFNILMELPTLETGIVPGIRSDGEWVSLWDESGERVRVRVEMLREHPMDAIRAIYRGLNLDPSPYQIEAAWKSVAPSTRA